MDVGGPGCPLFSIWSNGGNTDNCQEDTITGIEEIS